uniref:HAT C-terminal dimerisation domain-containing protein n=1 Tax=Timema cristinae TaxID=61476 RepID=A0A7R9H6U9_TIMCR|nr:unnamed protein product [Timema cristinae]
MSLVQLPIVPTITRQLEKMKGSGRSNKPKTKDTWKGRQLLRRQQETLAEGRVGVQGAHEIVEEARLRWCCKVVDYTKKDGEEVRVSDWLRMVWCVGVHEIVEAMLSKALQRVGIDISEACSHVDTVLKRQRDNSEEEFKTLYAITLILTLKLAALSQCPDQLCIRISTMEEEMEQCKSNRQAKHCTIEAFLQCSETFHPNVRILLLILANLLISTASPERSFSILKQLNSCYLCGITPQDGFTSVALLSVHREIKVDTNEVITKFPPSPRRVDFIL